MRFTLLTLCLAALLGSAAAPAAAQLARKPALTLDAARRVAAEAERTAVENGWNVVIAVVDDGGHPVFLQRMDDTQTASVEVALAKARSSASFRRPTREFAQWLADGRTALLALPGAIPIEGGVPLMVEGRVIGAIGVSGVTSQQDGVIAGAGAAALTEPE